MKRFMESDNQMRETTQDLLIALFLPLLPARFYGLMYIE